MAKAKKSKAKKSKAKKSKAKKSKPAKKRAAPKKAAKKSAKPAKKAAPKMKKQVMGEGDYQASRKFLKDEANFVKRHNGEIPQMGREAGAAMDGPQGADLRAAEAEAQSHSKAPGSES